MQVYTDSKENINADLSDLILGPAWTANSFEVFYSTTVGGSGKPGISVNKLMQVSCSLYTHNVAYILPIYCLHIHNITYNNVFYSTTVWRQRQAGHICKQIIGGGLLSVYPQCCLYTRNAYILHVYCLHIHNIIYTNVYGGGLICVYPQYCLYIADILRTYCLHLHNITYNNVYVREPSVEVHSCVR
jgi:hypothetical protein